jgi:UDP-glucose 4-epimerase
VDPSVKLQWALRIPWLNLSAAFLDYIRYPWVVDSSRLRNEIGYRFKYSSWETVEILLRAKGILK